jgi:hypothetical protein
MALHGHRAGGGELVLNVDHDQRFDRISFLSESPIWLRQMLLANS